VYWGRDIMLEVPVVAFMVGALWLFERLLASDRPSWALAVGWAALAALAMWTKQHAVFLVGVFALSALWARRRDLLRVPAVVSAAGLVVLAAALLVAWHLALGGLPVQQTLGGGDLSSLAGRLSLERWLFYPRELPGLVGLPLLLPAALGATWILLRREGGAAPVLTWIGLFYLMHSYNLGLAARYGCLWVPPFAALAVIGLKHVPGRLAGLPVRASLLALAVAVATPSCSTHPSCPRPTSAPQTISARGCRPSPASRTSPTARAGSPSRTGWPSRSRGSTGRGWTRSAPSCAPTKSCGMSRMAQGSASSRSACGDGTSSTSSRRSPGRRDAVRTRWPSASTPS
jgi:hypothetical protein